MRSRKKFTTCVIAALLVFSFGSSAVLAEEPPEETGQEVYEVYEDCTIYEPNAGNEMPEYPGGTSNYSESCTEEENGILLDIEADVPQEVTTQEVPSEEPAETEFDSEEDPAIAAFSVREDIPEEIEEIETEAESEGETKNKEETEEFETEAKEEYGIVTLSALREVEVDSTNFPDSVFREFIEENYDTNGDGVLDEEEISSVTELEIKDTSIHSLEGIELFTSLETLTVTGLELDDASVYFTGNISLKNVLLMDVTIDSGCLNFSGCTSLETLYLLFVNSADLNISECQSLTEVDLIYMEGLKSVNISGDSSLQYLYYNDPIILYADENSSIPEVGEFVRDDDDNEVWVPNPNVTIIYNSGTPKTEPDVHKDSVAKNGNTAKTSSVNMTAASTNVANEETSTADSVATDDSTPIGKYVSLIALAMTLLSAGVAHKLSIREK